MLLINLKKEMFFTGGMRRIDLDYVVDIKMIIYTVICIVYALFGKECTWILRELLADAKKSNPELDVQPHLI